MIDPKEKHVQQTIAIANGISLVGDALLDIMGDEVSEVLEGVLVDKMVVTNMLATELKTQLMRKEIKNVR